jgi:hypothetical protein
VPESNPQCVRHAAKHITKEKGLAVNGAKFRRGLPIDIPKIELEREVVTFLAALRDMPWRSPRMILEME